MCDKLDNKRGRVFSGMRPTGKLHIGHWLGALRNWKKLQHEFDCVFGIVDWHALAGGGWSKRDKLSDNIYEMAIDYLTVGIDPEKAPIIVQSQMKHHAELHVILSMIVPTPWLLRNPAIKEQARDLGLVGEDADLTKIDYGYLGYPVLQAADILVYGATHVPVGEDQAPHIELTREIVRRFNHIFGNVFPEPKTLLTLTPRILGTDNRKMSKSYGNCIYIGDEPDKIQSQVRRMITDPQKVRRNDPGHPDVCNVFSYHKIFNNDETTKIRTHCESGKLGCVACKKNLSGRLSDQLQPLREERKRWAKSRDEIDRVFKKSAEKAVETTSKVMEKVRKAVNLYA
ncbi:MAG: tryptophan--tRNA ligase [Candidatus Cloacimonetes bacterium 4572_55]|nr:MAG: tryptophan--tRNA ligase [Candidatus Cloacimonetes bacterium 4572_55]